jgi:hypothetical protein
MIADYKQGCSKPKAITNLDTIHESKASSIVNAPVLQARVLVALAFAWCPNALY